LEFILNFALLPFSLIRNFVLIFELEDGHGVGQKGTIELCVRALKSSNACLPSEGAFGVVIDNVSNRISVMVKLCYKNNNLIRFE
jgi:hypothetical protein